VALDGTGEKRERFDAAGEEREGARVGGGDGGPGGDGFVDGIARERRAAGPELGELLGLELAEAEEVGVGGMAIDGDDREGLREATAREAREQTHEGELIEEVVLVPEDQLFCGGCFIGGLVVGGDGRAGLTARGPVGVAGGVVLGVGDREERAFVERVGPDADFAGEIRARKDVGRAIAVADVNDALPGRFRV
jgi:hypothetical protein